MPFRGNAPPPPIVPPPVPPSQLPQHFAPTPLSRAGKIGSFVLSAGITVYAVLFYDFGDREHCFMPVRRWVDANTASFFTLTDSERRYVSSSSPSPTLSSDPPAAAPLQAHDDDLAKPDTRSPFEYFKEHPVKFGGKDESEAEKMV